MITDDFWDVRKREQEQIAHLQRAIASVSKQLEVLENAEALRSSRGFAEFQASIGHLHDEVVRQMVGCTESNETLRMLQGKAQALRDILTLLKQSSEARKRLAGERERLQNELNEVLRRRPSSNSVPEVL